MDSRRERFTCSPITRGLLVYITVLALCEPALCMPIQPAEDPTISKASFFEHFLQETNNSSKPNSGNEIDSVALGSHARALLQARVAPAPFERTVKITDFDFGAGPGVGVIGYEEPNTEEPPNTENRDTCMGAALPWDPFLYGIPFGVKTPPGPATTFGA
eukprot:6103166-Pyramimonas_sp.AAC.1